MKQLPGAGILEGGGVKVGVTKVPVAVAVAVGLGVSVKVGVRLLVGVFVGVAVGEGVAVKVKVFVGVKVMVEVAEARVKTPPDSGMPLKERGRPPPSDPVQSLLLATRTWKVPEAVWEKSTTTR